MGGIARFANRKPETTTSLSATGATVQETTTTTTSTASIAGLDSSFCDSAPGIEDSIFGDDNENSTYDDNDFGFMGGADSSNGNEFSFLHTNATHEVFEDFGTVSENPETKVRKTNPPFQRILQVDPLIPISLIQMRIRRSKLDKEVELAFSRGEQCPTTKRRLNPKKK
jgi:hypothetical protein